MFFRNLKIFRFPFQEPGLFQLEDALAECALKPVGPLELASRGFVSPYGRGDVRLPAAPDDHRLPRSDESVLESNFATQVAQRQLSRRAQFIVDQCLSPAEAIHIPMDFDPAPEADF